MEDVKRLLCIISSMNVGGAETFLMKIYRNLDRTKYQMDFCVNLEGAYDEEIKALGGKIYVIPCKSENLKAFKQQLKDIIVANNYKYVLRITSNAMGFLDLKIAKKAGAQRCIARSSNSSDGKDFKKKIVHWIGKLLYSRFVDVRIAPSDLAAKYTFGTRMYKKGKVIILHNALDINEYKFNQQSRNKIREEFGISEDTFLIGHVGRFAEQKNHMFLLEIFEEVIKKDRHAMLLLVGKGELQEAVKNKAMQMGISEKILFAGVREDISAVLSAMDVFVFPSLYEGMPNTVIEAQATGLPCIIADTITKEANITGLIEYLPLEDASLWAENIEKAKCSSRMNTMECFVENKYDIESATDEFIKCIF